MDALIAILIAAGLLSQGTTAQDLTGPAGPRGVRGKTGPAGPAGQDGADGADGAAGLGLAMLSWGDNSIDGGTADRYLHPWYGDATAETTEVTAIPVPYAATIFGMFVRHNQANGNGNDVVYTIRVNGVDTGITVTAPTGAIGTYSESEPVLPVSLVAGDHVTVVARKAAGIGSGTVKAQVTLAIAPTPLGP